MKTIVTILLVFSGLDSLQAKKFGKVDSKIIGGNSAHVVQFPWQARIAKYVKNEMVFCSAVLIDAHWVLTINYCIDNAKLLTVYLGGVSSNSSEEGRVEINSTNYIIHPGNYSRGIGLVFLRDEVKFNDRIRPIRMARSCEVLPIGTKLILSGYGRHTDNVSGFLRYIPVTTISNSECKNVYGSDVTDIIFCTKVDPLNAPCYGDGGGSLVLYDGVPEPTLYGINAFVNVGGCSTEHPVGNVNIGAVSDWIRAVTGIK